MYNRTRKKNYHWKIFLLGLITFSFNSTFSEKISIDVTWASQELNKAINIKPILSSSLPLNCIKKNGKAELKLEHRFCYSKKLRTQCSRMRVLVRELTKDGQELNLNQDVIGDKLPGIRYSFNSLEVALEDFLGSFKINVEPTAKELIVKPEYVCHKPSVKRLGKFLLLFARPAFEHIRGESTRYAIEIN